MLNNNIKFEVINSYHNPGEILILHERTTDVLYIEYNGNITAMLDPKTGLPLTYDIWENNYNKKK